MGIDSRFKITFHGNTYKILRFHQGFENSFEDLKDSIAWRYKNPFKDSQRFIRFYKDFEIAGKILKIPYEI